MAASVSQAWTSRCEPSLLSTIRHELSAPAAAPAAAPLPPLLLPPPSAAPLRPPLLAPAAATDAMLLPGLKKEGLGLCTRKRDKLKKFYSTLNLYRWYHTCSTYILLGDVCLRVCTLWLDDLFSFSFALLNSFVSSSNGSKSQNFHKALPLWAEIDTRRYDHSENLY